MRDTTSRFSKTLRPPSGVHGPGEGHFEGEVRVRPALRGIDLEPRLLEYLQEVATQAVPM
jgi:hypothetical protein